MKTDLRFSQYVTNVATVETNFDVDPLDNRIRVKAYHENLILTYAEMQHNDMYRMKVYGEILAVADYLKRTSGETINGERRTA